MPIDDQDYCGCDHTGCKDKKVEFFTENDSSTLALSRIANELSRLNDNLEKLLIKEAYIDRTYVPVMLDLSPNAVQKLVSAGLKK